MSVRVGWIVSCLLIAIPSTGIAAPTACPEHFEAGQAPDLLNQKLAAKTRELCFSGYADVHSGVTRTPLWSAEHLTRERLEAQRGLERKNTFHPEPRLPTDERAELSDYARSGFDRGHMSPSGDMPDARAQDESFSLANMVPQNPNNHRNLWEGIETAVRDLTHQDGEVYVVTGPIFQGASLQRLNGRVLVPTHLYKAIYDPKRRQAGAYLVENAEGDAYQRVSIADLQEVAGIDPFPGLPQAVKASAMDLPKPRPHGRSGSGRTKTSQSEQPFQEKAVLDFLRKLLR
jgi:endonuclease G